jgi:hypothetical protein
MMTPNDIEVLIHCHVSPSPHPRANAPAVQGALEWLREAGLIIKGAEYFGTTERGRALVQVLCDTPFPAQAWVDKDGKVIKP